MGSRVGVLGCGKMGGALAKAFVMGGGAEASDLFLFDRDQAVSNAIADAVGGTVTRTVEGLCESSDILVLAVKPQVFQQVVEPLPLDRLGVDTAVSVAAGIDLATLTGWLGGCHVIRTMPNRPALVRAGVTGLMAAPGTPVHVVEEVSRHFRAAGQVVLLDREELFDALTAVSGSGPAYVYRMVEALIDGGVSEGLSEESARTLAVSTVLGAGKLLAELGTSPRDERIAVSSPGGTTLAGLAAMDRGGFVESVRAAVAAAATRSRELGQPARETDE